MIEQLAIAMFGIASIWTSQDGNPRVRRWACLFGICAQPFWFYATITAGQWGMFALTVAYTLGWARGIRTYWFKGVAA